MLAVIAHAQDAMRAGVPWSQPYESCCALAASLGHAERFMGVPGALAPFVGHGVGSELDELPVLARGFKDRCLEAGMTIAVEPKVVFPGLGAVGIEDTFLVTPDGPAERLTLPAQQAFEV
jgi:Xaa-Pro dipeptidase